MTTPEITKAVKLLREGRLVAIPTETVYGLGADATNESAVRKIFLAKERPHDHPLIVHIGNIEQLQDWAREIPPAAMKLARAFWPGPLTLILKKQPQVLDIVTAGQNTVGLRIPRHPVARELLEAFGGGIAAPSANRFTRISPTTAHAVAEELGGKVDLILDGGPCEVGLESTIIDMSGETPVILRPGAITAHAIAAELGLPDIASPYAQHETRAPGMHHLHYAPRTRTILIETENIPDMLLALDRDDFPAAFVVNSDVIMPQNDKIRCIKMPHEAAAYAHDLYHTLRKLDHQDFKWIIIETVPQGEAWDAIRDRLLKATGSR
ncbi:L-threonylcarbamoyladenylate synthase [Aquicella lusitana]|uniref:Threonylcarbamoyl-AMP synthase n=1 Tax=Aquicella lusitana TaxID=254246 RepID=A0A370GYL5_9COXI|nr:L-threonylcarbamoyladenylate synthase [Aquicella lusitana]RDI46943.1 translation factor SUA5 [Aquicella lusitana]VVC73833.1 Threonylcarbamoyl-AMP synthase [Aquicella lusitana]